MDKKQILVAIGYSALTMVLGPLWHFLLFKDLYDSLGIYNRTEPIIPLGFSSMILQAILLAILYSRWRDKYVNSYRSGIIFAFLMGAFMFTTTTMANAAKIQVTSMNDWFAVQIGFHLVQFLATGLMIGFIYRKSQ